MTDASSEGLIHALKFDGSGGAERLDWDGVNKHWNDEDFVWVHLDYSKECSQEWLKNTSGLDSVTCDALMSLDSRPRSVVVGDGLLVNLRGVNTNPGADPDDMVSLRLWVEHHRLITLRQRRVMAVDEVSKLLDEKRGPRNALGVLVTIAERMMFRAGEVVGQLDERMDDCEEQVVESESRSLRGEIAEIRRMAIGLRRFLSPQRDAMSRLVMEHVSWISERDRVRLREVTDRVTRCVEDLDAIRDRAAVTQEELASKLAEQTNKTMYMLAVITGVFLPLGLLTGLLGINVGGMPGVDHPASFWVVCGILLAVAIFEIVLLRRKRWL